MDDQGFHEEAPGVAFLLTDVVGSTRAWNAYPDAMHAVMARHDELIERAVASAGGEVIRPRGEGDSRFAVFASASAAVAAAVAAMRALESEHWPIPTPIRIRAGIHVGPAERRAGDYYGAAVNLCSRLRGAAHPGQVLVSDIVRVLVRDDPSITLLPLGAVRLPDFPVAEPLHQVVADGLDFSFPAPRGSAHTLTSPTIPGGHLVGREIEQIELGQLVWEHSVVTVTGLPGSGKSVLACATALTVQDRFPGGTWLVAVEPGSTFDSLLAQLTTPLGIPSTRDVAAILASIGDERALVVLDDATAQLESAVTFAVALAATGRFNVLATALHPLSVAMERRYAIPPMRVSADPGEIESSDAVRLFLDRIARADAGPAAVSEIRAIDRICRQLEGHPLAIELAAARWTTLGPDLLEQRLSERLTMLSSRHRQGPERHRTLEGAIGFAVEALEPTDRAALSLLAVFDDTVSFDGIEAVAGIGAIDALDELVMRSLVVRDGSLFRLPRAVREFLRGDAPVNEDLALARTEFLLQVGKDTPRLLLVHRSDIGPAVDHLIQMQRPTDAYRLLNEALPELRRARKSSMLEPAVTKLLESASGELEPKVVNLEGVLAMARGDAHAAAEAFQRSLALRDPIADPEGVARTRSNVAAALIASWELERADRLLTEAASFASSARAVDRFDIEVNRGVVARHLGRLEEAEARFMEARSLADTMDDPLARADALSNLGNVALDQGRTLVAAGWLRSSLSIREEHGDRVGVAADRYNLGLVARAEGLFEQAES